MAFLPLLILESDTGVFLYTLPVVLTCSLVASRIVSMTFIPLLGYYLLRRSAKQEVSRAELRTRGFFGAYYGHGWWVIGNRWKVLLASFLLLAGGAAIGCDRSGGRGRLTR